MRTVIVLVILILPVLASYNCTAVCQNGYCDPIGRCECDQYYTSVGCDEFIQPCCRKRINRSELFAVAFFFGWTGAPYFMVGQTGLGVAILVISVTAILTMIVGAIISCNTVSVDYGCKCGDIIVGIGGWIFMIVLLVWNTAIWISVAADTEPFHDRMTGW